MRSKIWYELVHTKYGEFYLAHYLNRLRTRRKWYKMSILVFSTSGVLGWPIWGMVIPATSCVVIAVMQVVAALEPHLIASDKDIEEIGELRKKYVFYGNEIEKLWVSLENKRITEQVAEDLYFVHRRIYEEIQELDNKLHINDKVKTLKSKAKLDTTQYLDQYFSN